MGLGLGGGRERREVPSPLLSPQLREQGLSRKEEVKEGHGEAHPGRQVLSVVPEDLQEDNRQTSASVWAFPRHSAVFRLDPVVQGRDSFCCHCHRESEREKAD